MSGQCKMVKGGECEREMGEDEERPQAGIKPESLA